MLRVPTPFMGRDAGLNRGFARIIYDVCFSGKLFKNRYLYNVEEREYREQRNAESHGSV